MEDEPPPYPPKGGKKMEEEPPLPPPRGERIWKMEDGKWNKLSFPGSTWERITRGSASCFLLENSS